MYIKYNKTWVLSLIISYIFMSSVLRDTTFKNYLYIYKTLTSYFFYIIIITVNYYIVLCMKTIILGFSPL